MPSTFRGVANNTHPNAFLDPGLRKNLFWVGILSLSSVYVGYDASLLNSLQALPAFFVQYPSLATNSNLLGITGAIYSLAGVYTSYIAAWLADKYGRKLPIILGGITLVFAPFVMAFANNIPGLIMGRWLLGTGSFLQLNIAVTLLVEIAHPRFRAIVGSIFLAGFYVGGLICSFTTYGTYTHIPTSDWSWKIPTLVQAAFPALLLPLHFMMPQSPRYLVAKGRIEEARRIFAQQHANGDLDDPLVAFELEESLQAMQFEKNTQSWSALFKSKGNRKRLYILLVIGGLSQFTGNSVISYYLVPVLQSIGIQEYKQIILITAGLSISNLIFSIVASLLVDKVGRRPLWFSSTGTMLVCMIIVTALSASFTNTGNPATGQAVIAFLYIFFAGYCIGFTALSYGYSCEILPYTIRTSGLAFQNALGCIGLFFSTWVNPTALSRIGWKYYFVFIAILVLILVNIYFFFPETKGLTLEEVAVRFDGEKALPAIDTRAVVGGGDVERAHSKGEEVEEVEVIGKNQPAY